MNVSVQSKPKAVTVNYRCKAYLAQLPYWSRLDDLFYGAERWLGRDESGAINPTAKSQIYLQQEAAETDREYVKRLGYSPYNDFFKQAIRKFVNLIFSNPILLSSDFPYFTNIDNRGCTLESFLRELASTVMRRGHSFVLIDHPKFDSTVRSQADLIASGRRPYWIHYGALDVINWRTETVNGQTRLSQVTLRETVIEPDGEFGEIEFERFRVLRPGEWSVYQVINTLNGQKAELLDWGESSLPYIPLVCIYADDALKLEWGKSIPPLSALAELNAVHYRMKSDHLRKIHLCCSPVPVLRDSQRQLGQPFILGPSSLVEITDPTGMFKWEEPIASSIAESRREIQDLEAAADILSAAYLSQPVDRQSAIATLAQSAEIESSLQGFIAAFTSGVNECLKITADYIRSAPVTVSLSPEILKDKGTDSQLVLAFVNLATTLNDLPPNIAGFLLQLLAKNNFIPPDLDLPF